MLDGVVSSVGQAAEGGDVGGVDEGGDQALQVAHSTLCHGVGLDCIIRILHREPRQCHSHTLTLLIFSV